MYIPYTPSSEGIYAGEKIKQDREIAAARLQELLSSAEQRKADAQRQAELHPLAVRAKELGNQGAEQDIGLKKQEGVIKQEKAARDEDEDYTKIFPSIAAQVQHLPPSLARQVGESELGRYKKGRDMVDFLKKNNVPDAQWAEYLKKAGEAITRSSREYTQAMDVAGVRANQAETTSRINTEAAAARNTATLESRERTTAAIGQMRLENLQRAHEQKIERDNNNARNRILAIERQKELEKELAILKAKEAAGGKVDPKNYEALAVKLRVEAMAETEPTRRALLQAEEDDALKRSMTKAAVGRPPSNTTMEIDPKTGKPALGSASTMPDLPQRPGSLPVPGVPPPSPGQAKAAQGLPSRDQVKPGERYRAPDGSVRIRQ